jgi:hypothetical protein
VKTLWLLSIALIGICFSLSVYAEPPTLAPEIETILKEVTEADGKETGAVILMHDDRAEAGKAPLLRFTSHVVGKVFDDLAARQYGHIYIPFNSYYTEVTLDFARSISPDGTVTDTPPNAIQIKNMADDSFSDERVLTFAIPALSAGSLFEYQITVMDTKPVMKAGWSFTHTISHIGPFGRMDPVRLFALTLLSRDQEKISYEMLNANLEPVVTQAGNSKTYRWEMRNIPAIKPERDMPNPFRELAPFLFVSSLKDWSDIDAWAAERFLPKPQVSQEIKKEASKLTAGAKTSREKMEALFSFVQARVRYGQADLSTGGYVPRPPENVLRNLFGDCKDKSGLLLALLKGVDIEAYSALINAFVGAHSPAIPVMDFNHLIVYVPTPEGDVWLDTTPDVAEFAALPVADQGKQAFVINGTGGRFLTTPVEGPERNRIHVTTTFDPGDKNWKIHLNVEAHGAIGGILKERLLQMPENRRKELITDLYKSLGYKGTNVSVEYPDSAKPGAPFSAVAVFEVMTKIDAKRPMEYSGRLSNLLGNFIGSSSMVKPEERNHDFCFPFRFSIVQEWFCPPPAARMRVEPLPHVSKIQHKFFSLNITYAKEGEALRVKMELQLNENKIKKEDYEEFYEELTRDIPNVGTWQMTFSVPLSGWQKFMKGLSTTPVFPFFLPAK